MYRDFVPGESVIQIEWKTTQFYIEIRSSLCSCVNVRVRVTQNQSTKLWKLFNFSAQILCSLHSHSMWLYVEFSLCCVINKNPLNSIRKRHTEPERWMENVTAIDSVWQREKKKKTGKSNLCVWDFKIRFTRTTQYSIFIQKKTRVRSGYKYTVVFCYGCV